VTALLFHEAIHQSFRTDLSTYGRPLSERMSESRRKKVDKGSIRGRVCPPFNYRRLSKPLKVIEVVIRTLGYLVPVSLRILALQI
jgi:hypothetical protein